MENTDLLIVTSDILGYPLQSVTELLMHFKVMSPPPFHYHPILYNMSCQKDLGGLTWFSARALVS